MTASVHVVAALVSVSALLADRSDLATLDASLARAEKAYTAAKAHLQSGVGTGKFEITAHKSEKAEPVLKVRARVKTYFEKDKYHVSLDYEKDNEHLTARIVIFDGKHIMASRFSDRIRPHGAEADMYLPLSDAPPNPLLASHPHIASGFGFDPRDLSFHMGGAMAGLRKKHESSIKVSKLADGAYKFVVHEELDSAFRKKDKIVYEYEVSPDSGYNVRAWRVFLDNGRLQTQECRAVWERSGDRWIVKAIEERVYESDGSFTRAALSYEDYKPNVKVPEESFRFEALKLPPGARTIERAHKR